MKEFITAVEAIEVEDDESKVITFSVDGHEMKAYPLHEGQLTFMLAALGRGQSQDQRFASILNIMFNSLRPEDQDWFEARLLERDPRKRMPTKQVEEIFEYLVGEWFARPTQQPSDSATSSQTDGP